MMCIVVLSLRVGVVVVVIAYQNHRVTHSPPSVHAKVSRYIIYYTKKNEKMHNASHAVGQAACFEGSMNIAFKSDLGGDRWGTARFGGQRRCLGLKDVPSCS